MAGKHKMEICLGSSCFSRGNKDTVHFVKEWLRKNHLDDKIVFSGARCIGNCARGPNIIINGRRYDSVTAYVIESILEEEFGSLK